MVVTLTLASPTASVLVRRSCLWSAGAHLQAGWVVIAICTPHGRASGMTSGVVTGSASKVLGQRTPARARLTGRSFLAAFERALQ